MSTSTTPNVKDLVTLRDDLQDAARKATKDVEGGQHRAANAQRVLDDLTKELALAEEEVTKKQDQILPALSTSSTDAGTLHPLVTHDSSSAPMCVYIFSPRSRGFYVSEQVEKRQQS